MADERAVPELGERWLAAYGRAWEERDPGAAAGLFSADGVYEWGPFEEIRGREAIAARWAQATADQRDIGFRSEVLGAIGPMVVARWWCQYSVEGPDRRVMLDGVFLIDLDADGLCVRFREWWGAREEPD